MPHFEITMTASKVFLVTADSPEQALNSIAVEEERDLHCTEVDYEYQETGIKEISEATRQSILARGLCVELGLDGYPV